MSEDNIAPGSLLGKGSEFKGKLTFIGTVRVEGRFEGEVFSEHTLVVAQGAHITGTVEVKNLIITGGNVEAKVIASECVELYPPGRLSGEVTTPSFQMEKGAVFKGQCLMPDQDSPDDESEPGEEASG